MMSMGGVTLRDRFRGCLLGGAVGDALGAPIEFDRWTAIKAKFGDTGLRNYAPAYGRKGAITDDTQMTMFTVEGLIRADMRLREKGICDPFTVMRYAYERWLSTQGVPPSDSHSLEEGQIGWLYKVKGLHSRRAPGNTCLSALQAPWEGRANNDSKGCGGVMRVAPLGLTANQPYEFGCRVAAITHGHPLGYESAGALVLLVSHISQSGSLADAVALTLASLDSRTEIGEWLKRALELSQRSIQPWQAIKELGEGWVAEEALAIGVYCTLRAESFEEAVLMAVNHSGDSDSTGSIAGQIWGTFAGESSIPSRWLDDLELRLEIQTLADDYYDWFHQLARRGRDEWWDRYPGC